VLSIAGWLSSVNVHADGMPNYATQVKQIQQSEVHSPDELLDRIPFLAQIPRTFIVGDGFKMRLTSRELRVDHMGYRSHMRADQRNCMFGISYVTPVAGFFTYRLDLPLAHADTPTQDWSRSSLGDYVFYFSRTPVDHPTIKLLLSAKF
jgi:hypothetical protein